MAIRNKNLLNNAFKRIDSKLDDELVCEKTNLTNMANKLYALAEDMTDIIDTYNYCVEQGYYKWVSGLNKHTKNGIGISCTSGDTKTLHHGERYICTTSLSQYTGDPKRIVFLGGKFYICDGNSPFHNGGTINEVLDAIERLQRYNKNDSNNIYVYLDKVNYYSYEITHPSKDGLGGYHRITSSEIKAVLEYCLANITEFKTKAFELFDSLG